MINRAVLTESDGQNSIESYAKQ